MLVHKHVVGTHALAFAERSSGSEGFKINYHLVTINEQCLKPVWGRAVG